MMDMDAIVFYSFEVIVIVFVIRLFVIRIKVNNYVRKYHKKYWEDNFHLFFWGGSRISIEKLTEGLDDPKIENYKKEYAKAIKHLLFFVLLFVAFIICYIIFVKIGIGRFRKIIGVV
jgi:hypothetical protein